MEDSTGSYSKEIKYVSMYYGYKIYLEKRRLYDAVISLSNLKL